MYISELQGANYKFNHLNTQECKGKHKIKRTPGEESEPSILIALLNIPAVIEPPGE